MFVLLVHLHVKPEHVDAFRLATIENARASRLEPGVVRFDFLQETDDPARFTLVEVYRSRDAHAQHRETAHYKAWAAAAAEGDWLAEPRTRATCINVDPADEEW
jgi:quinol monooxygenase YgiN